jgi:hypothetical protein
VVDPVSAVIASASAGLPGVWVVIAGALTMLLRYAPPQRVHPILGFNTRINKVTD